MSRLSKWRFGETRTAPQANTALVTHNVTIGKRGYIMGYFITTSDQAGNNFKLKWKHNGIDYSRLLVFGGQGTVSETSETFALNEDFSADPQSSITIECLNVSTAGDYQASLLIAEETV